MSASTEQLASEQAAELSLSDALTLAVQMHRGGDVENSAILYRRILELVPEQPDALNFLGMIAAFHGRTDEALDLIGRSIAADPSVGERYANLGNVLLTAKRLDEAIAAYERAAELAPLNAVAYCNLGVIYRAEGRYDDAEHAYRRAIELDPTNVAAYNNYGNLRLTLGDVLGAVEYHAQALQLRPRDARSRRYLAAAYTALGRIEEAAEIYREWLQEEPDNPTPQHLLVACTGAGVPERAAEAYIEQGFDGFAATFESKLANLQYRAPELILGAVQRAGIVPAKRLHVLDAGCGTGLCGPLLAPYAATLTGVDLSSGMLERARPCGVYDELVKCELTQFLRSRPAQYDLVVSADTLCYFGVLGPPIEAAADALHAGGALAFTVERADEGDTPEGHRLNPHGRYSHTRQYVERTLAHAGFAEVEIADDVLRKEGGQPVHGLVVTAIKAQLNAVE